MWNKPVITIWNPRKNFKKSDMKKWTPDFLAFNRYVSMISISFDCSACCNILWNDICISFMYVFKNKLFYSLPNNMLLNDRKKHYKLSLCLHNTPTIIIIIQNTTVQVSVRPSACLSQWVWRQIWGVIYACKKTIS